MKKFFLALGLASGLAFNLSARETLRLQIEPDRDIILAGKQQEVVLKIDLTAADGKNKNKRMPLNIAVVLDRSGSMTGAKIEKARQAAMEVVDHLRSGDVFSVVTYDNNVEVLIPAQPIEDNERDKERIKSRIARIQATGGTALHAGVSSGAEQLQKYFSTRKINRVILLSDGLANVGPSSPAQLRQLGRQLSEKGISVTTIGVGDDYNEDLMAGLAEASDANYYYVQDTEKLPEIFAKELGELFTVAAREVRIEIILPSCVKPIGLIGRPEKFEGRKAVVNLSQLSGGQNRYLFLNCLVDSDRQDEEVAQVNVSYVDELEGGKRQTASSSSKITFTRDRKVAEGSIRNAVVVQKELLVAAVAKEQALADADAGRYNEAAQKLSAQAAVLEKQCPNAPAAVQSQIRQEVDNLRFRCVELQQGQYDKGSRKALQSESWTYRNSKSSK